MTTAPRPGTHAPSGGRVPAAHWRAKQRADLDYAVNIVGIDSVPGIVVNNQVLRGVPSATRLQKIVDQLTRAEPAAAPSSSSELEQSRAPPRSFCP